ncbi:MAG TPA: NAD(P)/FAD-dependent oxidoreductase [Thermoproteota archaeon]|nr:NAD(P)/FAD-dependent oxidoreductase [Thermoproteota archaeon]
MSDVSTVLVAGSGVSGMASAMTLAKAGVAVTILEEHDTIGSPCHCGGVVSSDYSEKIGIPMPSSIELNDLHGFRFTDGVREIVVRSSRPVAKVISRERLDERLGKMCEEEGVQLIRSKKAVSVREVDHPIVVDESECTHNAKYVVLAGGIADDLGHRLGFVRDNSHLLTSAQCVARKRVDPTIASIYLSDIISPEFFGYVVPINEEQCRIGVASKRADVVNSIQLMAKKEGAELSGRPSLWGIWTGGPISRTRIGNVFVVGDEAGMSKATTGGGIVFGALSGTAAAETIIRSLKGGSVKAAKASGALVSQLRKMRSIRKLLNSLGPQLVMEAMTSVTTGDRLVRYLETVDFDFHGDLTKALRVITPNPNLLPIGIRAIYHLTTGLFK